MSVTDISFKPCGAREQRRCSVPPRLSLSITLLFVNDTSVEARKWAHVFCCDLPAYEISPGSLGEVCTSQPLSKVFLSEMKRNCFSNGANCKWNPSRFRALIDYVCTRWVGEFTEEKRHSIYSVKQMQQRLHETQRSDVFKIIWNTHRTFGTCFCLLIHWKKIQKFRSCWLQGNGK